VDTDAPPGADQGRSRRGRASGVRPACGHNDGGEVRGPGRHRGGNQAEPASHYWAGRRSTLARLAAAIGKGEYYRLGSPRPGWADNPSIGTGAYALDQAWHIAWLWVAALVIAAGAAL
jgi:hypothetical protein